MKKRRTTFALLSFGFIVFIGLAMVSPPPGGSPILPTTPYEYQPENYPNFVSLSASIRQISDEKATLGRVLFYDTRLSKNDDLSCGSCHVQEKSFADLDQFSKGIDDILTTRNTPNLNDIGWTPNLGLFWDFRESSLHELVLQPVLNENELDGSVEVLMERLKETNFYADLFEDAYGDSEPTEENISDALASFIMSMTTFNSKYDQWYRGELSLSPMEKKGMQTFSDDCARCHTMNTFHSSTLTTTFNNGLEEEYEDPGMAGWNPSSGVGIFRSPSLRNIELTAPYMHDGRFETLDDVLDFYSEDIKQNPNTMFKPTGGWGSPAQPFTGFDYDEDEHEELLAFLKTLTDETFINDKKFSDPFPNSTVSQNEDILPLEGVTVAPNPIVNQAIVTYPKGLAAISIYDLHGRLVFTDQAINGTYQLDKSNLARGMYTLVVQSEGKQSSQKIILQ